LAVCHLIVAGNKREREEGQRDSLGNIHNDKWLLAVFVFN
jgi:hypothetical protein